MIKVEHLNKSFDGVPVLKDISVGYEPDSGEISYGDRQLSKMNYKEQKALRQKIGILFQGSALFDFATVIENVMFPMEFFTDWSAAQRRERAQYCIGFIHEGSHLWQGDRHSILHTDCSELRDFVCANTLARNIIEGR